MENKIKEELNPSDSKEGDALSSHYSKFKEHIRNWQIRNQEKMAQYQRDYRKRNPDKVKESAKLQYEKNKNNPERKRKQYVAKIRRYREDPLTRKKENVRNITKRAISLARKKCKTCGERAEHRHHLDYSDPYKIEFYCSKCHREVHKLGN